LIVKPSMVCVAICLISKPCATIRQVKPDVIVNAAAYTAVDKAESETDLADRVNGQASQVMAEEAASLDAWLIHYSTDYVFSGRGSSAMARVRCGRPGESLRRK
jgi:dTDP-4-dehydrorhamnose reductase